MNLTFYENSKEENNSLSPSLRKLKFPSIFSKFETEKNFFRDTIKNKIFLPYYKNIEQEIIRVKKQFRNLFNIKHSIFKEMMTKNNSTTYKNFIKGFGKYFFGPFGLVTQKNKLLRDYYFRISALNDKIFAGRLEYYDYMNKFNRYKQRKNIASKRILSISNNYAVITDKNDIYSIKASFSKRHSIAKDFISLNRLKCRPSISEINEISPNIININKAMNKTLDIKKSKNPKIKSSNKFKNNPSLFIKTFSNFYKNKRRSLFGNYKTAVSDFKYKNKKNYYKSYNTDNTDNRRVNSHINIKFSREKMNDGNISNFFLTQGSITNQIPKLKIRSNLYNGQINLKKKNIILSKFNKLRNKKTMGYS